MLCCLLPPSFCRFQGFSLVSTIEHVAEKCPYPFWIYHFRLQLSFFCPPPPAPGIKPLYWGTCRGRLKGLENEIWCPWPRLGSPWLNNCWKAHFFIVVSTLPCPSTSPRGSAVPRVAQKEHLPFTRPSGISLNTQLQNSVVLKTPLNTDICVSPSHVDGWTLARLRPLMIHVGRCGVSIFYTLLPHPSPWSQSGTATLGPSFPFWSLKSVSCSVVSDSLQPHGL